MTRDANADEPPRRGDRVHWLKDPDHAPGFIWIVASRSTIDDFVEGPLVVIRPHNGLVPITVPLDQINIIKRRSVNVRGSDGRGRKPERGTAAAGQADP